MKIIACISSFAGVSYVALAASALAQQRTTASYEDWTVSCVQKKCEIVSVQTSKAQANLMAQITIDSSSKEKGIKVSFQIPANAWLAGGIKLFADDKDSTKEPAISANFRWCIPERCLADTDMKQEELKKLCDRDQPGRLLFLDASQKEQKLPISFKGLCQAFGALLTPKTTTTN